MPKKPQTEPTLDDCKRWVKTVKSTHQALSTGRERELTRHLEWAVGQLDQQAVKEPRNEAPSETS